MFYAPAFGILFGCSPIGLACTQGVYVYTYICFLAFERWYGMGCCVVPASKPNQTKANRNGAGEPRTDSDWLTHWQLPPADPRKAGRSGIFRRLYRVTGMGFSPIDSSAAIKPQP